MTIPLVDLKAQTASLRGAIDGAMNRVISRANFIQGEEVSLFEREFAEFCGVQEAVGVASGTEALRLALLACGVKAGDEVITTPFTFIATSAAISQVGATPVFVDVEAHSCNLDPRLIEAAITSKTKAILPVHLYGRPADMDGICAVARKHGLKVIEDCAQAHAARFRGRRTGSLADAACFSFYPAKNLGAFGDGGMVVTSSPEVADEVRLLRDHGRRDKYEHLRLGSNSRLDTLQAAILRVKLPWLDKWTERRQAIAASYRSLLQNEDLTFLAENDEVYQSACHLFVIQTPQRGQIRRALSASGIETGVHYPIPLHMQPAYHHLGYRTGDFPACERASQEVLSLPIYPELPEGQVREVAEGVKQALKSAVVKV
jgi:dTDP-4-amino-4,6-dideoxygalactose transaminase